MKISNNIIMNQNSNPKFKSASGFYMMQDNKEMGYFTWFFRDDLPWDDFIAYEINHFKDKEKVNIVQFGASDGSEAYSQIIGLLENPRKENVEKFFPIEAYDINESLVERANSSRINFYLNKNGIRGFDGDVISGYCYTNDIKKYFTELKTSSPNEIYSTHSVNPDLKKRVNFNLADMFEKLPEIQDDSNTVVLCRNCLGYFGSLVEGFIKKASEVLKQGSLFVIGRVEHEIIPNLEGIFKKNSFKKVMDNVYQKL